MKKSLLLFALIGCMFSSCSSDDGENLSIKGPGEVAGSYTGSCTVTITEAAAMVKTVDTEAAIEATSYSGEGMLKTSEFNWITEGDKLRNFEYTSSEKIQIKFSMSSATVGTEGESAIPAYIKEMYITPTGFSTITKVVVKLNKTSGLYAVSGKNLLFNYTGTISIYGTSGENSKKVENLPVTYAYALIKK